LPGCEKAELLLAQRQQWVYSANAEIAAGCAIQQGKRMLKPNRRFGCMGKYLTSTRWAWAAICVLVVAVPCARGQNFTVLHAFAGGEDGRSLFSGVAVDKSGTILYGAAYGGGDSQGCGSGCGDIYRLVKQGSGWVFSTLYSFQAAPDGNFPMGVVLGPDGFLYGTTAGGGINNGEQNCLPGENGCGTVFQLKPANCTNTSCAENGSWKETMLYQFSGMNGDGGTPQSGNLTFDSSGKFYGTTQTGGAFDIDGTVFEMTPSAGSWTESVLYSFNCAGGRANDGFCAPQSGVVLDPSGDLYGTALFGGQFRDGVVYQLTRSGPDWAQNVLHAFNCQVEACGVVSGVIIDGAGNLYGGAANGGVNGGGTVYELPASENWNLDTLVSFEYLDPLGGTGPYGSLIMDAKGNLYGTTQNDGIFLEGTVFELSPSASGWVLHVLHEFTGGSDGGVPLGGVAIGKNDELFGTTFFGGDLSECLGLETRGCGVVWEITR
jgi:hypothetical protein